MIYWFRFVFFVNFLTMDNCSYATHYFIPFDLHLCITKKARNISPGLKTNYEKFILSQKSVRCEATGQQS